MSGAPASLNSPNPFAGHPAATRTLFFVEMWERFSYYGLGAVLVLFMASPVSVGGLGLREDSALTVYGTYASSVFLLGVPLSLLADGLLGPARAGVDRRCCDNGWTCRHGDAHAMGAISWARAHCDRHRPAQALHRFVGLRPLLRAIPQEIRDEALLHEHQYRRAPWPFGAPADSRAALGLSGIGWHLAFASAAAGMGLGLILYSRIRGDLPSPAPAAPVRAVLAGFAVSLVAAVALGIFLLFSPHAWVVYAVVVGAFVYFRFLSVHPESGRRSLLLLMLIVSIVCSSLIGQMFSSLTLLADKFVGRDFWVCGWPPSTMQSFLQPLSSCARSG